MNRGRAIVTLLASLAAALVSGCGDDTTPEARLRQTIDAMETAAEEGRRGDFMDRVATDFSGQAGRLNRDELANLLRVQILQHSRVHAVISDLDIRMFGDRATASMKALLTGGPRAWLPESGRLYRIESGWRLDGDEWVLINANWETML